MLIKFAASAVLDRVLVPETANRSDRRRIAKRHQFKYTVRPGFLYVRSRMISSRCNDNYDEFPAEEIRKSWKTFIGKPVFVNHANDNHRRARGVIIDAALHEHRLPSGDPDVWVEGLMEIDAVRFPKLAEAIMKGDIARTSMGTDVAFSKCSACGNKAETPAEYCKHIPKMKGQRIWKTEASTGKKVGILVREICYGLGFFENSLLVEDPADPTAFFTGVDASGLSIKEAILVEGAEEDLDEKRPTNSYDLAQGAAEAGADTSTQGGISGGSGAAGGSTARRTAALRDQETCPHDGSWNLHGQCMQCGWSAATEDDEPCDDEWCKEHEAPHSKGEHIDPSHRDPYHPDYQSAQHGVEDAFGEDRHLSEQLLDGQPTGPTKWSSLRAMAEDFQIHFGPEDLDFLQHMRDAGEMRAQMHDHAERRPVNLSDPADLKSHLMESHEFYDEDFNRNSHPDDHPALRRSSDLDRDLTHAEMRAIHEHEHALYHHDFPNAVSVDDSHFHTASIGKAASVEEKHECVAQYGEVIPGSQRGRLARSACLRCGEPVVGRVVDGLVLMPKHAASKPVSQMSPDEYKAHQQSVAKAKVEGEKWNRQHPPRIKHVVAHWDQATEAEKAAGESWYSDAHHMAHHIANDTGTPMHTMAGLISNYSPQTHWAANIHNAARVARTKEALGGPGSGILATNNQKKAAKRLLEGEHYDKVLAGPKTRAFAHLIEHGDNQSDDDPKVVVDRHAMSVACGARATDDAYSHSRLGGKAVYQKYSDVYHKAAKQISKKEGRTIKAHQVQATTWLVRQRLNTEDDHNGIAKHASKAVDHWNKYAAEHHPTLMGKEPGTGYSRGEQPEDVKHVREMDDEGKTVVKNASKIAYGETKAPADVDTLRDADCPVCGEADSYEADRCTVCGFSKPPQVFADPDLELARQVDLRKDVAEQNGLNEPSPDVVNELDGQGMEQSDGESPVDPSALDENGEPRVDVNGEPVNPEDIDDPAIAEVEVEPGDDEPVDPSKIGEDGEPEDHEVDSEVDPDAAAKHFNQGGEPFTQGPNMPAGPGEPEGPDNPESDEADDGQEEAQVGQEAPGRPNDGTPDLGCPSCGFTADATQPLSVGSDPMGPESQGDGLVAGDACPQCRAATLMSLAG